MPDTIQSLSKGRRKGHKAKTRKALALALIKRLEMGKK
jgi:hypothetical protein